MYNRKNPKGDKPVTKLQLQVLYNEVLALVQNNQSNTPITQPVAKNVPIAATEPIILKNKPMSKYFEEKREIENDEQYKSWLAEIESDPYLKDWQRKLLKTTNQ